MAKRILSADSALMPSKQNSLSFSVRTEKRGAFLKDLEDKWRDTLALDSETILFDWQNQHALRQEIAFVNQAQSAFDEAAVKLAPSLLRIVLTVKRNIGDAKAQRAYLAEHLRLDFRRVSELCIVADSYGLLDSEYRQKGEREIAKYGWSNALKLAYVRDPYERREIWERACEGKPSAGYRAVLEEIRRFRDRKLIAPPEPQEKLELKLGEARVTFARFSGAASQLDSKEHLGAALEELRVLQKELGQIRRALQEHFATVEIEEMAASA